MKNKILIFTFFICFFGYAYGEEFDLSKSDNIEYVPGEVIIKYKDTKKSDIGLRKKSLLVNSLFDSDFNNLEIKEALNDSENIVLMGITDEKTVEDVIETLQGNVDIEYVEPNYIRYFFYLDDFVSEDSLKSQQWGLENISWKDAFQIYSGRLIDNSVLVGIIDNGVNYFHPDLIDSMWNAENCIVDGENIEGCVHGYDFFYDTFTPLPNVHSHGTHIAGIIGAGIDNGGIIGVNPFVKMVSLKVGRNKSLTAADELRAIYFAIDNGIKIVNASYGASTYSDIEKQAIQEFGDAGGLFVTSAGNGNVNNIGQNLDAGYSIYPCKYDLDNILCVAAIGVDGKIGSYSNYGLKTVDIAAPGTDIISTVINNVLSGVDNIFSENFENCDGIWSGGICYVWKNIGVNYGYLFSGELSSPKIDLGIDKSDIYLSFAVSCESANVEIQYSKDGKLFESIKGLGLIDFSGSIFNLNISSDFYTSDFMFRLQINDDESKRCVIDDVEIYSDPYISAEDMIHGKMSGTSMATPYVVGLASHIWSLNPKLSYLDVKNFIMNYGDENVSLVGKVVSGKTINVKKTLDAVVENIVSMPSSLVSSWTGVIAWDYDDSIEKYYYEIFDGNEVILSGITKNSFVETELSGGEYLWRVKGIDTEGNESKFGTSYICKNPKIPNITLSSGECSSLVLEYSVDDKCGDMYEIVWSGGDTPLYNSGIYKNSSGLIVKNFYVKNSFGEKTDLVQVDYIWYDAFPTIDNVYYEYSSILKSYTQQDMGNVVSLFGVKDGACGEGSIKVLSILCTDGQAVLNNNKLFVTPPYNKQGSVNCSLVFEDDENNQITGVFSYSFDTIKTQNGGGGGGGGWGGGGGGSTSINDKEFMMIQSGNDSLESVQSSGHVKNYSTGNNDEQLFEKPRTLELFDNQNTNNGKGNFDFSWYNDATPSDLLSNGYTVEFNNAYEFAYEAGITTMNSIENANMNGNLTRVAMAKMLSQYAINILGKKPANIIGPKFSDVSQELDDNYGGAIKLSYQLGIMGQNMKNNLFRPDDMVTRAEFATALSRLLYGTEDGLGNYYSTHLDKLYREGIINNTNPNLKELRGYVMIMLMRTAKQQYSE